MRKLDEGGYGVQNKARLREVEKNNMQRETYRHLGTKPLNFVPPKQDVVMVREAPLRGILKNSETPSRSIHTQSVRFNDSNSYSECYRDHYRDHYTNSDSDSDDYDYDYDYDYDGDGDGDGDGDDDYGSEVN